MAGRRGSSWKDFSGKADPPMRAAPDARRVTPAAGATRAVPPSGEVISQSAREVKPGRLAVEKRN